MNATLELGEKNAAAGMQELAKQKGAGLTPQVLLDAYAAAGLSRLKVSAELNARIDAAERVGLVRLTLERATELLYRSMNSLADSVVVSVDPDWQRRVGLDSGTGDWGHHTPTDCWKVHSKKSAEAFMRVGAVGDLSVPVPRGVAHRIAEAKESGLFDEVCAIAPVDAFVTPMRVDPVVLGIMCRRVEREIVDVGPDDKVIKLKKIMPEWSPSAYFLIALWH